MRKLWILSVLAAVLFSACGANPDGFIEDTSTAQTTAQETTAPTTTAATVATTTTETTATTKKLIQQIQVAEIITTTKQLTTEVTIKVNEDKIIPLNVETKRGEGTLTFIQLKIKPETSEAIFYYETSDEQSKMTNIKETSLVGKSKNKYKSDSFGGTGNKGDIIFQNITDFTDLSTVTLTYAFEGFDPVTVTFDIPGI